MVSTSYPALDLHTHSFNSYLASRGAKMPHLKCDCTSCTALKTAPVDLSPVMECWHTDFIGSAEEDEIVAKTFPNVTYPNDGEQA